MYLYTAASDGIQGFYKWTWQTSIVEKCMSKTEPVFKIIR
jgi:hypothetical protein